MKTAHDSMLISFDALRATDGHAALSLSHCSVAERDNWMYVHVLVRRYLSSLFLKQFSVLADTS